MYHKSIPPYSIYPPTEKNKNYTVVAIYQGYDFFTKNLAEFNTRNEAKEYIRKLLKDGSDYSFWKRYTGYSGTEEDFFEFCCNK